MKKMVIGVDGMRCGMCETHVNDAVRKVNGVVRVKSSAARNVTEVVAEDGADEKKIVKAISELGYRVMAYKSEPYERKKLFGIFGGR